MSHTEKGGNLNFLAGIQDRRLIFFVKILFACELPAFVCLSVILQKKYFHMISEVDHKIVDAYI